MIKSAKEKLKLEPNIPKVPLEVQSYIYDFLSSNEQIKLAKQYEDKKQNYKNNIDNTTKNIVSLIKDSRGLDSR